MSSGIEGIQSFLLKFKQDEGRMKIRGHNWAIGVVAIEWMSIVIQLIGFIVYVAHATSPHLWVYILGFVAYLILCICLAILLTRGVCKRNNRELSIWIIIEYVLFVLSFVGLISLLLGYLPYGQGLWAFVISLIYRCFVLKIISEFNQEIKLEQERERRKSLPHLPQQSGSSIGGSHVSIPVKLTQNNLEVHQAQYTPVPHHSYTPTQYEYDYAVRQSQTIRQPLSTISLSASSQPNTKDSNGPQRLGRSYSESTV